MLRKNRQTVPIGDDFLLLKRGNFHVVYSVYAVFHNILLVSQYMLHQSYDYATLREAIAPPPKKWLEKPVLYRFFVGRSKKVGLSARRPSVVLVLHSDCERLVRMPPTAAKLLASMLRMQLYVLCVKLGSNYPGRARRLACSLLDVRPKALPSLGLYESAFFSAR